MTIEHIFGKEQPTKIFKVAFDETKTKVISARTCKVDTSGSLYVNERGVPPIKKQILNRMMCLNFFENTEKVKPTQVSTTLQRMSKSFQLQ